MTWDAIIARVRDGCGVEPVQNYILAALLNRIGGQATITAKEVRELTDAHVYICLDQEPMGSMTVRVGSMPLASVKK